MKRLIKDPFLFVLIGLSVFILLVSLRVTLFRYSNFEYGKFDLGNMSQMVYNSLHGHFMEVTDYFGANMPRWGMSHFDPLLLIFVPVYAVFPDARVLIVGQLVLLISSSLLLYFIGKRVVKSKFVSFLIAASFLFYPAVGFLLAWTGFHGVTSAVPFFLASFLVFEEMYATSTFTKKRFLLFIVLVVLTLAGKEEISLIYLMYGLFIIFFRKQGRKIGVTLSLLGLVWFIVAFFILIPSAANYRIEGFKKFAQSTGLSVDPTRDVLKPNYFLSRYAKFGDSYLQIIGSIISHPLQASDIFFSGDKKQNFTMTFAPVLFVPFFYLPILAISLPEFMINYLTTASGLGTGEIFNHRISMIIPLLFLSVLFSIKFFERFIRAFLKKDPKYFSIALASAILLANIYTSNEYQNPILLWFTQSIKRRLTENNYVLAKTADATSYAGLKAGDSAKVNKLETKDRSCFDGALSIIPKDVSTTSPDYLGDHLSTRRYNALFPANFDSADYVVVDVYSRKVLTILGLDQSLINDVVGLVLKNPNYETAYSCSNIFVFRKVGLHGKSDVLPLQESFDYKKTVDYKIGLSLFLVDFKLPETIERGKNFNTNFVYQKQQDDSLNSYIIYTSFLDEKTGTLFQIANLPSFGVKPVFEWDQNVYYIEDNSFVLPKTIPEGSYKVFVGMTNNLKTFNIYLGKIEVK